MPHPESVAGELDFGLAWFRRDRESQLDPDETGGIRILSPSRLFRSGRIRQKISIPDTILRKRFYIFFVARDEHGQLRKISIPVHYLYVLLAGAAIGIAGLTGIASSYTRMLQKVSKL